MMSAAFEDAVKTEIRDWSAAALEKPSQFFNGMAPCPYARKAWAENKVAILFKYETSQQVLFSTVSQFDDNYDVAIIVDFEFYKDPDVFHTYLDEMNDVIADGMFLDCDIWVMGFHPEDEESEFVEELALDFDPHVEDEYALIFVQRLSKLQEAADKLATKGYYETYDVNYNAREIYEKRERLYRRLKDGDET